MKKIILAAILVLVVAVIATATAVYRLSFANKGTQIACTMEAKLCPDGSAVGRTGPKCEFAPCSEAKVCSCPVGYIQEGDACNPECYYSTPRCLVPSFHCQ